MISNSRRTGFKILVDADACPVKNIIGKVAEEFGVTVVMIASIAHSTNVTYPNIEYVWVDKEPQAVDMSIVNQLQPGDLVVTGDFGLASMVLAKGGKAISSRGRIYHEKNIEILLTQRHIDAKIRRGGGKTKGPKALSNEDKQKFETELRCLLSYITSNENFYR